MLTCATPIWMPQATTGVQAFDLDFGRIAVVICYDINFAELWMQASALNADIVVWPSAMQTPDPSSYVTREQLSPQIYFVLFWVNSTGH